MPRAQVVLQSLFPYTITGRCINQDWFQISMDEVWSIYCEELQRTHKDHNIQIHSFVLMSNHYHLIASTPEANISDCMQQFMWRTSRRLTTAGNRINQTYGGRHYKCILQHHNYYLNAYKYNYRNPVEAGICERVEDYPYSTLRQVINPFLSKMPLLEDSTYKSDPAGTLRWLNTKPEAKKLEGLRWGFKHQYFKSKKDRTNNKAIIGLDDIV